MAIWAKLRATEHKIDLRTDAAPSHQIPYRKGLAMGGKTAQSVQEQLDEGVIKQATSEWASPVVFDPLKRREDAGLCRLPSP